MARPHHPSLGKMEDESYPTDLHLALSLLLYGEYLPPGTTGDLPAAPDDGQPDCPRRRSTDYWLIDEDVPERANEGDSSSCDSATPRGGLFLRSEAGEPSPLIDLEGAAEQLQILSLASPDGSPEAPPPQESSGSPPRQTLFLAPMPPPAPPLPRSEGKKTTSTAAPAEGLFIRSDLDDWVVA